MTRPAGTSAVPVVVPAVVNVAVTGPQLSSAVALPNAASIASAGEPGKVILDYLVTESKAWQVFTQINNFGSEGTGVWRARVGYQDNQLTNHDDILNVEGDPAVMGKAAGTDRLRRKNSYPELMGLEPSKKFARMLADEAVRALAGFDAKADPLRALAAYVVDRKK